MGVLVGAEIKDRIVLFKYVLCSISVVHIEVYHKDFVIAYFLSMSCANSHIVKNAKSHGPVCLSVVARRSHGAKCTVQVSFLAFVDSICYSAGSEKSRIH